MADANSTDAGMPFLRTAHSIVFPDDATNIIGCIEFEIGTPHGPIHVEAGCMDSMWCRGTPEAIIGFGLIDADWLPGLPGRGATTQSVYFGDGKPTLPTGQNRRGARPKGPRITIRAWGHIKRTVDVQIPLSDAQIEKVREMKAGHYAKQSAGEYQYVGETEESKRHVARQRPMYRKDRNIIHVDFGRRA